MIAAPILITGGFGFLGSHLATRFSAAGEAVRILARPERKASAMEGPPHEAHEVAWGDIRDPEAVERAVQGVEVVIHTVSNFRKGGSDEREAYAVNVEGTKNVLAACRKAGVGQLIHCSTIGVHGSVVEIPADEETPFNPLDLYQETKVAAEQEVWKAHRETGLPVTVIRPISMFGPGDRRMLKFFQLVRKGLIVGDGQALFQPAYIDDVVDGFQLALRNPKALGEAFIVGGEEYVPLRELFQIAATELGVPPPRFRVPLLPVLFMADVCEKLFTPLRIEPPLHRRRISFFQNNRACSVRKAKEVLGFHPQMGLRESLRTTIGWYREQGWL